MKFIVLGTSDFTLACASGLLDSGMEVPALISLPARLLPNNSTDVGGYARTRSLPYHEVEDINAAESIDLLRHYRPDYIFSSWPRMIHRTVLRIPEYCVIGTHPTDLPRNRGRHPLHWLMVMGIHESMLSFFLMDEGVDTGNILHKERFSYSEDQSIGEVVQILNNAAYQGTRHLCELLRADPRYQGKEQPQGSANYWRKRTLHDVTLDMRMTASLIVQTVRSFAPPYPAANLIVEDHVLKVERAWIQPRRDDEEDLRLIEPGRILGTTEDTLTVKAADGIVTLQMNGALPAELSGVRYIHPPSKYLLEHQEVRSRF